MYNKHLDTFILVADAGSFSKGAELMYISPNAVIKQINLLEEELGLQLFNRTHRVISLIEAGKSLYKDAKYLIQYSQNSLTRARQALQKKDKTIRVGTSLMTTGDFLMDLWPQIKEYCPDISLQLVPYENTPENAREILKNLGQNIDIVAGIFDHVMTESRGCTALELKKDPICLAVSINHPLANLDILTMKDLHGETIMILKQGYFQHIDMLRDDIWQNYQEITIEDFTFYDVNAFNWCENSNYLLMAFENWSSVHPLLKILPVEWDHTSPYGLFHSLSPSDTVQEFLEAVKKALKLKK